MLKINGKDESSYIGKTVSEYIKSADYKQSALAVELNNEILSKKAYDTTVLKDNDVLEIVWNQFQECFRAYFWNKKQ